MTAHFWLNLVLCLALAASMVTTLRLEPADDQIFSNWKVSTAFSAASACLIFVALWIVDWERRGDGLLFTFVGCGLYSAARYFIKRHARTLGADW